MIKGTKTNQTALGVLISLGITTTAMAGTMGPIAEPNHWFVSLSGGAAWARGGDTQTFFLTPEIEKTYSANKSNNALGQGEVFLGLQKAWSPTMPIQFGLAVAATGAAKMSGVIFDDADPQFDNFTYGYKVQHTRLSAKAKVLFEQNYIVTPWISGSVGIGFNRAYGYDNTPLIFEAVKNPNFGSHTKTAFAYTVGAGLQKSLNDNWQVGVGYEFADWGKSQLASAPEQTLNSGLGLNHLYTNGVLLNVTYVI